MLFYSQKTHFFKFLANFKHDTGNKEWTYFEVLWPLWYWENSIETKAYSKIPIDNAFTWALCAKTCRFTYFPKLTWCHFHNRKEKVFRQQNVKVPWSLDICHSCLKKWRCYFWSFIAETPKMCIVIYRYGWDMYWE